MNHSELADILDEDDGADYIALSPEDLRELVDEFDRAAPKPVVPRVREGVDEPWPSDNEPHHFKWVKRPEPECTGPIREEWLEQARNESAYPRDCLTYQVEGFDPETGAIDGRWVPPEGVDEVVEDFLESLPPNLAARMSRLPPYVVYGRDDGE